MILFISNHRPAEDLLVTVLIAHPTPLSLKSDSFLLNPTLRSVYSVKLNYENKLYETINELMFLVSFFTSSSVLCELSRVKKSQNILTKMKEEQSSMDGAVRCDSG